MIEIATVLADRALHRREAADEFSIRPLQRLLGIDLDLARDVGDGEEQVADLLLDHSVIAAIDGGAQLGDFLFHLVEYVRGAPPVESDTRGFFRES